jgi:hypothetical protein
MLQLLVGIAVVCGLVRLAADQSRDPTLRTAWRDRRLRYLSSKKPGSLTPDEAADGSVLARELGRPDLEARFKKIETALRRRT